MSTRRITTGSQLLGFYTPTNAFPVRVREPLKNYPQARKLNSQGDSEHASGDQGIHDGCQDIARRAPATVPPERKVAVHISR